MKLRHSLTVFLLALVGLSLPVQGWSMTNAGGFSLSPSLFYSSQSYESTTSGITTDGSSTSTFYDMKFGYTFGNGFHLGINYAAEGSDDGTTNPSKTSYGPILAYSNMNWVVALSYFVSSVSSEFAVNDTVTYTGTGLQFDVAYYFQVGSNFAIGPQLAYKSFTFDKIVDSTVDFEYKLTQMLPMVALSIQF